MSVADRCGLAQLLLSDRPHIGGFQGGWRSFTGGAMPRAADGVSGAAVKYGRQKRRGRDGDRGAAKQKVAPELGLSRAG